MDVWHFTEMPYPHLPPLEEMSSMWVTLPNRVFDPKIGADLYKRYFDEYVIADELGFNLMVNEHHQTATCMNVAVPLSAAILARQTKKGRICVLGNPVANRGDPIRVAEEMAMIDCISHGRLEAGFVRGVPYEIFAANTNPTQTVERLWEAVDLVVKAWTTHDGPFNFEGRFTHRRAINIWPRPYQTPASADLDHRLERFRGDQEGREPRLCVRDVPAALRQRARDVRRLPQRLSRLRAAGRRRDGFHAAGLYRGFRTGGGGRGAANCPGTSASRSSRSSATRRAMCRSR